MSAAAKSKILVSIIGVLLLVNIGMLIFFLWMNPGKKPERKPERPHFSMTSVLEKEVGFSKEQLQKFEQLREKHRKQLKPLFDSLRAAKDKFYKLLKDPALNDSILNDAARSIGESQEALDLRTFKQFQELKTICTPEQQPKLDSVIQGMVKRMTFPFKRGGDKGRADSTKRKN